MIEDNDLRKALDETMDWMSDLSPDELRQVYPERRVPCGVDFIWEIGGTEYTVISHFNQNSADDIVQKVQNLLENKAV